MKKRHDIIIVGGSFAGLTLALALAQALNGKALIGVINPSTNDPAEQHPADVRASALSASSKRLLTALGIWTHLELHAQPVTTIELTDSRLSDVVRPTILTYDNTLDSREAATIIVPNDQLKHALQTATHLANPAIKHIAGTVTKITTSPSSATLTLADGRHLETTLVIGADGKKSQVREAAGIKTVSWDYPQTGIVTSITHEKPHNGRAYQHFLPGGPFAILPLPGNRACITWSEDKTEAARILALSDPGFLLEIEKRCGHRLGQINLSGSRQSWPLDMHLARAWIANRIALVGDAAHGVHPIAGQGLNLGFRDVAALTDVISDAASLGLDFGLTTVLERYERWRRLDSTLSTTAFDGLNALFSSENTALRTARGAGLSVLDRLPAMKRFLVAEAAGVAGVLPSLMRRQD
jgi:2-octaprenyl-6-methoxyphenol hydroxylase